MQIFTFNLRDRIEWDLCSHLTPEQFTEAYCAEIGLSGEAKPIIAHAIHEELLKHKKDAYELKLYGPGALQMDGRKNAPMKLREVWREWNEKEEFGPVMVPLRMDELIQKEQERDRAARYVLMNLPTLTLLSEAYFQADATRDVAVPESNWTPDEIETPMQIWHVPYQTYVHVYDIPANRSKTYVLVDCGRSNAWHETGYRGERKLARQVLP